MGGVFTFLFSSLRSSFVAAWCLSEGRGEDATSWEAVQPASEMVLSVKEFAARSLIIVGCCGTIVGG
jgi:hypothetical protein